MATDAFAGLFGSSLNPQQLQNQLIEQQASQMAGRNLSDMGAFLGYKGGAQLGRGAAGLFGVDVTDPTVKKATDLRRLAEGIDIQTTTGLKEYATRLQSAGFLEEAAKLSTQILAREEQEAKTGKLKAEAEKAGREKQAATPAQQLARTGKFTPASLDKYEESGKFSDLELIDKTNYAVVDTKEGVFVVNKNNPSEKTRIGSPVERGTNLNVGLSTVDKEGNLRQQFTAETKPISTAVSTANRIEQLLNMGSLGEIIAQKQFSKLAGDNNISNRDVEALSNFGDVGQRLAGVLTRFFEGTYSEAQKQEALRLVRELKNSGTAQYNQIKDQYRNRGTAENLPSKTVEFIAPDLPEAMAKPTTPLPPEGTRLRNKKTGKIEVVRNGKLVPEGK